MGPRCYPPAGMNMTENSVAGLRASGVGLAAPLRSKKYVAGAPKHTCSLTTREARLNSANPKL